MKDWFISTPCCDSNRFNSPGLREHEEKCVPVHIFVNPKWVGWCCENTCWTEWEQAAFWNEGSTGVFPWGCGYSQELPSLRRVPGVPGGRAGPAARWGQRCPRPRALPASPGNRERDKGERDSEGLGMLQAFMRQVNRAAVQQCEFSWLKVTHPSRVRVKKKGWKDQLAVHTHYSSYNTDFIFCKYHFLYLFILISVLKTSLFSRTYFPLCFQNYLHTALMKANSQYKNTEQSNTKIFSKVLCCSLLWWLNFCISVHLCKNPFKHSD